PSPPVSVARAAAPPLPPPSPTRRSSDLVAPGIALHAPQLLRPLLNISKGPPTLIQHPYGIVLLYLSGLRFSQPRKFQSIHHLQRHKLIIAAGHRSFGIFNRKFQPDRFIGQRRQPPKQ